MPRATREFDLSKLPPPAAKKLQQLRQDRDDLLALTRELSNRSLKARDELMLAQARLDELRQPQVRELESETRGGLLGRSTSIVQPLPQNHPFVRDAIREVENCEQEIARVSVLLDERNLQWTTLGQTVRGLEAYLTSLDVPIQAFKGHIDTKLRKGESITEAVEARRRRLRELRSAAHRIRSAPIPAEEAKEVARKQIAAVAHSGRTNLLPTIKTGQPFTWPRTNQVMTVDAATMAGDALSPVKGQASIEIPNAMGLLAWLFKDKLVDAVEAEIESLSDDDEALTDQERKKQLRANSDDGLMVQREEERFLMQAQGQGQAIARRVDADPRAVLDLASELPSP